jgi:hypothetical protein
MHLTGVYQVGFPNKDAQFKKGKSGNPAGRPPGILNLESRVRRLLEGEEKLPEAIAATIRYAVGDDRQLLDALLIVGALQALQGDEKWAKLLLERGYGKVADKLEGGDPSKPVKITFGWEPPSEK